MGRKPSYFKIGVFVIIAASLLLIAVVIFGSGLLAQNKLHFETYFNESITGLIVGSPVEFRGVHIGQVETITFAGGTYKIAREGGQLSTYEPYVRVVFFVPRQTMPEFAVEDTNTVLKQMIAHGLRVRVNSNILTGQAYLEANYLDPNRFPVLEVPWTPIYPYIPSAPSELTTLKDSLDKILFRLQEINFEGLVDSFQQTLVSVNKAIADANLGQVSQDTSALLTETRQKVESIDTAGISHAAQRLLDSLDQTVADANVPELSAEAKRFIQEIRVTNDSLQRLLAAPEGIPSGTNIPEVIARLNRALSSIDRLVTTEKPDLEVIIANFREISDSLRDLTESLRERPSELFFSKPPRESEAYK
jgi:phospholipid/cholesterol/gamma-HCH transport system substrate-binding protein